MENNNAAANSNVNTEVNNNPAGVDAGTEKTFTQEEVNNIVQERLARERAKMNLHLRNCGKRS